MIGMDPWKGDHRNDDKEPVLITDQPEELQFEDNFNPSVRFTANLPDSDQYLATLEEKLRKLKNDPDILRQLAEKRQACIENLVNGFVQLQEDEEILDEPLQQSQILRTIQPHKQALTRAERIQLLHYDQLVNESDSDTEPKNLEQVASEDQQPNSQ